MLKILVPVNGSACSLKAVDEAIRTARANGDAIVQLVNVQPLLPVHVSRFLSHGQTEKMRVERAKFALGEAQRRVEAAGLRCSVHMLRGRIVPSVTAYATEAGVDQIVIGTSPVRSAVRLFRESIADGLIEKSTVPVDVVRGGEVGLFERFGLQAGLGLGLTIFWLANE